MRMVKAIGMLVGGLLLALAGEARAQTPVTPSQFYVIDQSDYGNVTRFELRVDTEAWVDVGRPAASGAANTVRFPLPAMTPGPHVLVSRACNLAGCSAASPDLRITMVAIPSVPSSPRIESAPPD
jgi:hypothetical protein